MPFVNIVSGQRGPSSGRTVAPAAAGGWTEDHAVRGEVAHPLRVELQALVEVKA